MVDPKVDLTVVRSAAPMVKSLVRLSVVQMAAHSVVCSAVHLVRTLADLRADPKAGQMVAKMVGLWADASAACWAEQSAGRTVAMKVDSMADQWDSSVDSKAANLVYRMVMR